MIDASAPVEVFGEIDSTVLEARRRVERGDCGPVWLVARRQSAGRGRRGRAWVSLPGNLLATALFPTSAPAAEIALLGFATGLAIADTLEALEVSHVGLKWPNDIMIGNGKCAGVLIDSGATPRGQAWVALSFGVNLAAAPKALDYATASVREALPAHVQAPSALELLATVRDRLAVWAGRLANEGFAPLRAAWLQRAYGLGREALVMQGGAELRGRLAGLSARGELELDTDDGRRLIAAGDVFLSNAA